MVEGFFKTMEQVGTNVRKQYNNKDRQLMIIMRESTYQYEGIHLLECRKSKLVCRKTGESTS